MSLRTPVVLVVLLTTLLAPPVTGQESEVPDSWWRALERAEQHLHAGDWSEAEAAVEAVLPQMVVGITGGEDGSDLLGLAVYLRAVARVGQGRHEDGLWDWWMAQNLDPELQRSPLPDFGPPRDFLDARRLRSAGGLPRGNTVAAELPERPAAPLTVPYPLPQSEHDTAWWRTERPTVEIVVDAEGRVTQPVVLESEVAPGALLSALEVLRNWSYRPAFTEDGPVASIVELRDFTGDETLPYVLTRRGDDYAAVHRLLLDERWREAAVWAEKEIDYALRCGLNRDLCTRGRIRTLVTPMIVAALAAAGAGDEEEMRWQWHRLLNLRLGQSDRPSSVYGDAGRRLQAVEPPCTFDSTNGCEAVALGPGVDPPRPLSTPPMEPPFGLVLQRPDRSIARILVDREGRVRHPWLLAGESSEIGILALETLRGWRFEPARVNGEPVRVILEATVPQRAVAPPERIDLWTRALDDNLRRLQAGDPVAATARALHVLDQIRSEVDSGGSDLLARAYFQLAVAHAAQGREEDALWDWWTAQNLAVELRYRDLSAFGAVAGTLSAHRLRQPGEAAGRPCLPGPGEVPPAVLATRRSATPSDMMIEVEVVVDPEGRAVEPLVLVGLAPEVLIDGLAALRGWRFAPPTSGSPRCRRVWVFREPAVPLQLIRGEPRKLAHRALTVVERDSAEGACLWQSAVSWDLRLTRLDLYERGAAGDLLAASFSRRLSQSPRWDLAGRRSLPPVTRGGGGTTDARPLEVPPPELRPSLRRSLPTGLEMVGVVTEEGRFGWIGFNRPLPALARRLLTEDFCRWRFEPATFDGEPTRYVWREPIEVEPR